MVQNCKEESIRILQFIDRSSIGGTQDYLLSIAEGLDSNVYDVYIACPPGPLAKKAAAIGLKVIEIKQRRLRNPLNVIALLAILRKHQIDIIHMHTFNSGIVGIIAAVLAGVETRVFSMQGYTPGDVERQTVLTLFQKLKNMVVKKTLEILDNRYMSVVVVPSYYDREYLSNNRLVKEDKIAVVHNSIDAGLFKPTLGSREKYELKRTLGMGEDSIVVTSIARLVGQKGIGYLIEAAGSFKRGIDRNERLEFLIVGDGPLMSQLQMLALSLGISTSVKFLGSREDLIDILEITDIFVLPSLWEGLPLTLLMAMSMGKAVVTTPVNGINDIVVSGCNGLLVPIKDSNSLADGIRELFLNEELRDRYGKEARKTVLEEYNSNLFLTRIDALYQGLTNGRDNKAV